jgi:alpha-beta hydrolase superfamily lysophospholipase
MFVNPTMTRKKIFRRSLIILLGIFVLMNVSAYMHAFKFTHFTSSKREKTSEPGKMGFGAKMKALFLGIDNPRPALSTVPSQSYETIVLQSNKKIECWSIKAENSKGTVILFHGYRGDKSSLVDKSDEFIKIGYSTFLVDFMGSGGSEGNQTTIGFMEAEQVRTVLNHLISQGEKRVILFGTSMGAVAILRSFHKSNIKPSAIILECPFGSMYETTKARFRTMGVPAFPMANLLVFWGGVQNGFKGFSHKPTKYAKAVNCPTLLLYGEKDEKVSRKEIDNIFMNLGGEKSIRTYPNAGHENYLSQYREEWISDVSHFLSGIK